MQHRMLPCTATAVHHAPHHTFCALPEERRVHCHDSPSTTCHPVFAHALPLSLTCTQHTSSSECISGIFQPRTITSSSRNGWLAGSLRQGQGSAGSQVCEHVGSHKASPMCGLARSRCGMPCQGLYVLKSPLPLASGSLPEGSMRGLLLATSLVKIAFHESDWPRSKDPGYRRSGQQLPGTQPLARG